MGRKKSSPGLTEQELDGLSDDEVYQRLADSPSIPESHAKLYQKRINRMAGAVYQDCQRLLDRLKSTGLGRSTGVMF